LHPLESAALSRRTPDADIKIVVPELTLLVTCKAEGQTSPTTTIAPNIKVWRHFRRSTIYSALDALLTRSWRGNSINVSLVATLNWHNIGNNDAINSDHVCLL